MGQRFSNSISGTLASGAIWVLPPCVPMAHRLHSTAASRGPTQDPLELGKDGRVGPSCAIPSLATCEHPDFSDLLFPIRRPIRAEQMEQESVRTSGALEDLKDFAHCLPSTKSPNVTALDLAMGKRKHQNFL